MADEVKVKLLDTRLESQCEEDNHSDESEDAVFIEDTPVVTYSNRSQCNVCGKASILVGLYSMTYSIGQGLIEGSYSIPLLLTVGVGLQYTGFIFAISYLLLLCLQVLCHCCSPFTFRHRPFIILFYITSCLGLAITPFAPYISTVNELSWTANTLSVIITALGLVILGFIMGQLQLSSRPHLLTMTDQFTHAKSKALTGNFLFAFSVSGGLSVSFSLGAISFEALLNSEMTILKKCQIIFVIALFLITVFSVLSLFSANRVETTKKIKCVSRKNDELPIQGLFQLIYFIASMTKEMWILSITVFLSTISMFPLMLYFTTIVSLSTHNGVLPNSVHDIQAFKVYSEGIRKGCFALTVSASFVIFVSLILTPLAKSIGLRTVFLIIQYLFVIALFVFSYWPTKLVSIIVIGSSLLTCYCMLETVPFSILLMYKVSCIHIYYKSLLVVVLSIICNDAGMPNFY